MDRRLFDALDELGPRVANAPKILLAAHFDGTLALLDDAAAAGVLPPGMHEALAELAERPNVVLAVLSGREKSDLQKRVGLPGIFYAGNHGLEISGPGACFVEPTAVTMMEPLKQLAADLATRLEPIPDVVLTDKGLTLSVSCARADPAVADEIRRQVHAALAAANHPFHLTTGERVFEVQPRVTWHKGSAVAWIAERAGPDALVVYLGNDATDEDVFTVNAAGITVKVGPAEQSVAKYSLVGPTEVLAFLQWLIVQVAKPSAK